MDNSVIEDRTGQVDIQLITWFSEMGHFVYEGSTDIEAWNEQWVGRGPEVQYGWTTPFECPDSPTGWAYAVNPHIVVELGEGLNDGDFVDLIDCIEYRLNKMFGMIDSPELYEYIDASLLEEAPGSLELLQTCQANYLNK